MNRKKIILISLMLLVGFTVFVSAYFEGIQGTADKVVYTTSVFKGWNLLNAGMFTLNRITAESVIKKENIVVIYYYSPVRKQYIRIHPNLEDEKYQQEEDSYGIDRSPITSSSVWVYVNKEGMLQYETDDVLPTTDRKLSTGWNFVSLTEDNIGKMIADFKGDCNIQKVYYYLDGYQQLDINTKLENDFASLGLLIKTSNSCNLGSVSVQPPQLPY